MPAISNCVKSLLKCGKNKRLGRLIDHEMARSDVRKIETLRVVVNFEPCEQRGYILRALENPELRKNVTYKGKKLMEK